MCLFSVPWGTRWMIVRIILVLWPSHKNPAKWVLLERKERFIKINFQKTIKYACTAKLPMRVSPAGDATRARYWKKTANIIKQLIAVTKLNRYPGWFWQFTTCWNGFSSFRKQSNILWGENKWNYPSVMDTRKNKNEVESKIVSRCVCGGGNHCAKAIYFTHIFSALCISDHCLLHIDLA